MPSPFPGMDPFLEHPDIFPDLQHSFVVYLSGFLNQTLPELYYSKLGRRTWVEEPHDESSEPFAEVCTGRGEQRRVTTHIEVLSRLDKTPGDQGRELYLRTQREVLDREIDLIEVDLLRGGTHTTAVPLDRVQPLPRFDYHICVRHFERPAEFQIYSIRLTEPLPAIEVRLPTKRPGIALDLQAVFQRCYDAAQYNRQVDYRRDSIDPPLTAEQAAWVRKRLEETL